MLEADYRVALTAIATVISVCNLIYYLRSVFKGQTKPHIYTWLVWSLVTGIAAAIQFYGQAGVSAYLTAWVALACFLRFAVLLPCGEKEITKSDTAAFGFCLISIVVWFFTKNPFYSLLIVTTIDGLPSIQLLENPL